MMEAPSPHSPAGAISMRRECSHLTDAKSEALRPYLPPWRQLIDLVYIHLQNISITGRRVRGSDKGREESPIEGARE